VALAGDFDPPTALHGTCRCHERGGELATSRGGAARRRRAAAGPYVRRRPSSSSGVLLVARLLSR